MKRPPLRKVKERFVLVPDGVSGYTIWPITGLRQIIYREILECGHNRDVPAVMADDAYKQRQCNQCFAAYELELNRAVDEAFSPK